MDSKVLFRFERDDLYNGLWYNRENRLVFPIRFCKSDTKNLPMGYDPRYHADGKNWFSSCSNLTDIYHWYKTEDIKYLLNHGFVYCIYLVKDYKEYDMETVFLMETAINRKIVDVFELIETSKTMDNETFMKKLKNDLLNSPMDEQLKNRIDEINNHKMHQILTSLLQNDFYKFNMGNCIYHQHQNKKVRWAFKCRSQEFAINHKKVYFTPEMVEEIKRQVKLWCNLRFKEYELEWLRKVAPWLHKDFTDYLKFWHPEFKNIEWTTDTPCGLGIHIEGTALEITWYETPIMSIICEVFYRMGGAGVCYEKLLKDYKNNIEDIISKLKSNIYVIGNFSDFGFRRRLSAEATEWMVSRFKEEHFENSKFCGTSDVYLARLYDVKPIGTMAHELCMLIGQGYPERNPAYSNKFMLESWVKEYGILNGIALTDTIGTDAFLKDFNLTYATLFSGCRHDSGDPFKWGDKMIEHYKKLGIDSKTKTLLFSDSLTFEKATNLYKYFKDKSKVAFGIGGSMSSPKNYSLNIVIKPIEVDGNPVAKLSDVEGKNMCEDPKYIEYLRKAVEWRLTH